MTSQPWILSGLREQSAGLMGLQWSHDLSAMDTVGDGTTDLTVTVLQWSHDLSAMDTENSCMKMSESIWLQWSHDLSAMDTTAYASHQTSSRVSLQWSHDLSAMDTWIDDGSHTYTVMLQWSHDLSAMDTSPLASLRVGPPNCFNGAMTFQPWIRRCRRVARPGRRASMEP